MGYICTFMDNDTYTAQDVNTAFSHLTSEGVAIFEDTGDLTADLDSAVSEVVSSGAVLGACKVIEEDGTYKISAGTCFMADGSQITFDSNGYEITPIENTKSYVYLKREEANNTIRVVVSSSAGETGTVPLAEISALGVIADKRKFAMAKIGLSTANIVRSGSVNIYDVHPPIGDILTIDMGFSGFKYLIVTDDFSNYYKRCIDLSDGEAHYTFARGGEQNIGNVKVRKEGSCLVFTSENNYPICIMNFEVI